MKKLKAGDRVAVYGSSLGIGYHAYRERGCGLRPERATGTVVYADHPRIIVVKVDGCEDVDDFARAQLRPLKKAGK